VVGPQKGAPRPPGEARFRTQGLATAKRVYGADRGQIWKDLRSSTRKDAHQVRGLGDAAYISYGVTPDGFTAKAELVTYWGNAEIVATYEGTVSRGTTVKPVARQTAEAAVLDLARDSYTSLS
jgi:hypothetical protein